MERIQYKKYPITIGLIVICALVYIYTSLRFSFDMTAYEGLEAGAFNPIYVFSGHQFYRLISANFIHFGIMHIVVNCYSLFGLGCFIESSLGSKRYCIVVVVSALSTTLLPGVLYLINGYGANTVSGGISGVIFGVIGALGALALVYRNRFMDIFRSLALNIVLMLAISFLVPSISLSGHVSGLIGGFVSTYIILMILKRKQTPKYYN